MKKLALFAGGIGFLFICASAVILVAKNYADNKIILTPDNSLLEAGVLLTGPVFYKPVSALDAALKLSYLPDKSQLHVAHTVKNTGTVKMQFEYYIELKVEGKKIFSGKADPSLYAGLLSVESGMFVNASIVTFDIPRDVLSQEIEVTVNFSEQAIQ